MYVFAVHEKIPCMSIEVRVCVNFLPKQTLQDYTKTQHLSSMMVIHTFIFSHQQTHQNAQCFFKYTSTRVEQVEPLEPIVFSNFGISSSMGPAVDQPSTQTAKQLRGTGKR